MKKHHIPLTLAVTWIAMVLSVLIAVGLPWILVLNSVVRTILHSECIAIQTGYYCCLPFILLALWKVRLLLVNIQNEMVFTEENVKLLAAIRNCCAGILRCV